MTDCGETAECGETADDFSTKYAKMVDECRERICDRTLAYTVCNDTVLVESAVNMMDNLQKVGSSRRVYDDMIRLFSPCDANGTYITPVSSFDLNRVCEFMMRVWNILFNGMWSDKKYDVIKKIVIYNPFICHNCRNDESHQCDRNILHVIEVIPGVTIDQTYYKSYIICSNRVDISVLYPYSCSCSYDNIHTYINKQYTNFCVTPKCLDLYYNPKHKKCAKCDVYGFHWFELCDACAIMCNVCMNRLHDCRCNRGNRCGECDIQLDDDDIYKVKNRMYCETCYVIQYNCMYCGEYTQDSNRYGSYDMNDSNIWYTIRNPTSPELLENIEITMIKYNIEGYSFVANIRDEDITSDIIVEDNCRYIPTMSYNNHQSMVTECKQILKEKLIENNNAYKCEGCWYAYDISEAYYGAMGVPKFVNINVSKVVCREKDANWLKSQHYYIRDCKKPNDVLRRIFKYHSPLVIRTHIDCFTKHNKINSVWCYLQA